MKNTAKFALGVIMLSLVTLVSAHEFVDYHNNPYSPTHNHHYRRGVVPNRDAWKRMRNYSKQFSTATTSSKTLTYGGGIDGIGVTSGTPKVYLVFWGSQWGTSSTDSNGNLTFSNDIAGAAPVLQKLFKGLGTGGESWSGTMTQYCDGSSVSKGATSCPSGSPHVGYPTGGALAGVWYDNSTSEPANATPAQISQEAINAAAHFGNTTAASNRYVQYLIVSSTGLHPDGFNTSSGQFCAWHDYTGDSTLSGPTSPYGDIAFSNIPYMYDAGQNCGAYTVNSGTAGSLDGMTMGSGHEYAETITDQNPPGGWTSGSGSSTQENGDECAWITSGQGAMANVTFGTGTFAMQSTWSNDTNECDMTHAIIGASVNATPVASSGTITTSMSTPIDGTLNASDTDGDTLVFAIVANPSHGTVVITNTNTGAFTYTPSGGYTGNDSFTFKATDGSGNASNVATESVTINSTTNTAPVASNGSVSTNAGTAVSGKLTASDTDGDTLAFSIATSPGHGTLTLTNAATGAFTYTPASGYSGTDSFTFKATDSAGNVSNTATETVTVKTVTASCPSGYTRYTGTIMQGQISDTPNFYFAYSGTEAAKLSGPAGTNFDLYLYWWNGWSWQLIGLSTGLTSSESITVNYAPYGYYGWQIYARSGSGTFNMCVRHP